MLSNAYELSTDEVDGQKVVQFEPTPLMSPYLLALAAGNLRKYDGGQGSAGRRLHQSGAEPLYSFYSVPGLEWQLAKAAEVGRMEHGGCWGGTVCVALWIWMVVVS